MYGQIEEKSKMGNCKDCDHWKSHWDSRYKECEAVEWRNPTDLIADNASAIYAYALDDSGLDAGLRTGPMFGCTRFKPRNNT